MKRIGIGEFRKAVSVHKLDEWFESDGSVAIVADGKVVAYVVQSVHIVEPKSEATASVHKLGFSKEKQAAGKMRQGG